MGLVLGSEEVRALSEGSVPLVLKILMSKSKQRGITDNTLGLGAGRHASKRLKGTSGGRGALQIEVRGSRQPARC